MKRLVISLGVVLVSVSCSGSAPPSPPAEQAKPAGEIPITSKSPEAIDLFRKGRDLSDNLRSAEAVRMLDSALNIDPDFALALAYRGNATPGPDGLKDLEQANLKAGAASKPEQLLIAALLSGRKADVAKSQELWTQLTDAAPGDWRAHMGRGAQLYGLQKYRDALDSLNRATALNPNAGPAFNMIGYAYLVQGDATHAVEALKKYAGLAPNEPNPHDSLGEALMANGQFAEAEAEFQKALALSPSFNVAWEGIAYTKFFRGDWEGGQAAVVKAREASSRGSDRLTAARLGAYGKLAEGKTDEGLKAIDDWAKSPDATPINMAFASIDRAGVLAQTGRYRDAVAEAGKAMQAADGGQLPPGAALNARTAALAVTVAAQGHMGDAAGAKESVAALQKQADARPGDPAAQSALTFAQGMLSVAQKDMNAARAYFEKCPESDFACQWQAMEVARRAGDKTSADAFRAHLTKQYVRDPVYVYARASSAR